MQATRRRRRRVRHGECARIPLQGQLGRCQACRRMPGPGCKSTRRCSPRFLCGSIVVGREQTGFNRREGLLKKERRQ